MSLTLIFVAVVVAQPALAPPSSEPMNADAQWSQWRGPLGTGVAPRGDPPVVWSEAKNVRWKTAIPGLGHSSPIVWGDRIFLTTAIRQGEARLPRDRHAPGAHNNMPALHELEFAALALDRHTGRILWTRTLRTARPHASTHETGSWASNSPVTDGERLIVSFGSHGLYALDMSGEPLWRVELGEMNTKHGHGEGSSPALYGDTVVVNWDHEGGSFVVALDKRTGERRWRVARDEGTSWSTPLVVEHKGNPQVIIAATNRVRAYSLTDGQIIWECGGLSGNVVASPVAADGVVYVANSYDKRAILAIDLAKAKGDVTDSAAIKWTRDRYTPYVPSPLLFDGALFFLKHYQGFLSCVDAETGTAIFGPQRLTGIGNVFASPVGAAGRIYIVSRNGATAVVKRAAAFEQLALNKLDDMFSASPAIVGTELYLRGEKYLYCISEERGE